MSRAGIFGGSFDPIHVAHLAVAEAALAGGRLDQVLFVPAGTPPHKPVQPEASDAERLHMVELAIAGHPAFQAVAIELERQGPSYTLLTVRELRRRLPGTDLFLILGGDSVRDLPTWWRADDLVREIDVIAFDRPGAMLRDSLPALAGRFGDRWVKRVEELRIEAPLLDVSATEVRRRVRAGQSIRRLVPASVRAYIEERGLYRGGP
jgi:nicotinate-nucleotide adenylyltransferase